jgi:hypothetical protein
LNHAKEILAQGMSEKQLNSVLDMLESEMNVTMDAVGKVATRRVENVSTPSLGGSSSAVSDSDLVDSWGKR